jgi:drug/metabolite transporter (DMT)-like permease
MAEAAVLTPSQTPLRAYSAIVLGILAVSLAAIFIRLAQLEGVPSLFIAAARLTLAALILTPFAWSRYAAPIRQLARGELLLAGISGLFLALHFATWILSLEYTSVLIAVVLVSTGPLWIALLETIFLKARLGSMLILGLILAIMGGVLIGLSGSNELTPRHNPALGSLLALSGAIAFAVYMVIGRKLRAQLALLPYIWLVYSCAAGILLATIVLAGTPVIGYTAAGYLWVVALGLVPQLIGHSSFNYAVKYLPATFIGIAGQLEPVMSTILAVLVLQEEIPQELQVWGSAAILIGVTLAGLAQARSK